ncbi:hypothetical protein ACW5WK_02625 [Aeromonas enteropelogenes]|uniref:hypothetical protein n=1 Tax=Aeromonas enteropelogenes TaxID=29489 RepID=UPI0005A99596|nr:hypothetical protein [Aeromonas enteropelogenes]UBH56271.1 hypothetical protein LA341_20755 [Aeromonas enteropelogenes]
MNNEEKLVKTLLMGAHDGRSDVRAAALVAIGESGMIDEDRFIKALEDGAEVGNSVVKAAAYTGMGLMLKSANRQ